MDLTARQVTGCGVSAPAPVGALLPQFSREPKRTKGHPPSPTGPAQRWLSDKSRRETKTPRRGSSSAAIPHERLTMELKRFLNGVFGRETGTSLSRRDALAGLGLAGALLAAPSLLAPRIAEAKPLDKPNEPQGSKPAGEQSEAHETRPEQTRTDEAHATEPG